MTHVDGTRAYLVLVDDMVLGGLIYRKAVRGVPGLAAGKVTQNLTELLSDFAINQSCKLAKLVAMLARSRALVAPLDKKGLRRTEMISTMAFSDNHASMKYRGAFKLVGRSDAHPNTGRKFRLAYLGAPVDESPQEIFGSWWAKHGKSEIERYRNRDPHGRPALAQTA